MAESMVERVAKALFRASFPSMEPSPGEAMSIFGDHASAAIEAMKEPTQEMLVALGKARINTQGDISLEAAWRIMHDAALPSPETTEEPHG